MTNEPESTDPAPGLPPEDIAPPPTSTSPTEPALPPAPAAPRRLYRSRRDDWLGGVAGGLADYFDTDPTLIRIAFVVAAFISAGVAVVAYVVAWIVIPEAHEGFTGGTADGAPRRRSGATGALIWGGLLIVAGTLVLLSQLDLDIDFPPWEVGLSVALILVGVLMLIEARRGFNGGLLTLAVILTLLLGLSSVTNFSFGADSAFGDSSHVVRRVDDLEDEYSHAFGQLTVDLRQLDVPQGTTTLEMSVVFGNGELFLPPDIPHRIEADSVFGSIEGPDMDAQGVANSRTYTSPGYEEAARRLDIRMSVVFGSGRIR